jgi:predicted regulator of Ras-like GTPase activity (Roadblock/LC7/MglB family)
MHDIVTDLIETLNARAALIVAKDGMVVACEAREGVRSERLAALGTAVITELTQALAREGMDGFTKIELAAERGKLVVVEAGPTYILVLVGARLEIGPDSIEIRSAAQRVVKEAGLTPS